MAWTLMFEVSKATCRRKTEPRMSSGRSRRLFQWWVGASPHACLAEGKQLDTVINCAGISIPFKRPSDNLDDRESACGVPHYRSMAMADNGPMQPIQRRTCCRKWMSGLALVSRLPLVAHL